MPTRISLLLLSGDRLGLGWAPPVAAIHGPTLLAVGALVIMAFAAATLVLVAGRLHWAMRAMVAESRERQRSHRRLLDLLHDHLERMESEAMSSSAEVWSIASALPAC